MFWGSFSGLAGKGPTLFYKKDWPKIGALLYPEKTVPLIAGWITMHPQHILMHDGAPGHRAGTTVAELREREITVMKWPPYSPDLNPIERIWHFMKNILQEDYPERMSVEPLRKAIQESWDAVSQGRSRRKWHAHNVLNTQNCYLTMYH